MEKLLGELGIDIGACPFTHSADMEDAFALALVLHYQPALMEAAAMVTMHRRRNLMKGEDVHDLKRLLDDEVLTSCMLTPDFTQPQTFINERVNDHTTAVAKKDRLRPLLTTVLNTWLIRSSLRRRSRKRLRRGRPRPRPIPLCFRQRNTGSL